MSFVTGKQKSDNLGLSINAISPLVVAVGTDSTNLIAYSTNGGSTWVKTGSKAVGGIFANLTSLLGVATNGTIWVVVGNKGSSSNQCGYSYDGKSWTAINIDATNNPTQLTGVAWNGSLFVTGSQTPTRLYYSYDGVTWSISPTTVFTAQPQNFVWISNNTRVYANNGFWLCGGSGSQSLAYSANGILWGGLGANSPFGTSGSCYGICTDGSGLVVVGGQGNSQTMAYATLTPINDYFDPSLIGQSGTYSGTSYNYSWTALGSGSPFGVSAGNVYSIAYNGTIWLAGGQNSGVNMAYSYNGKTWASLGSSPFGTNASSICNGVCWTGTYWVATGSNNTSATTISVAYCTDPLSTWTTDSGGVNFSSVGSRVTAGSNIIPTQNDGVYGSGRRVGIQFQKSTQNSMNFISGGNQVATLGEKGFKTLVVDDQYGTFIRAPVCIASGVLTTGTTMNYSFNGISFTSSVVATFSGTARQIAWNGKIWVCAGESNNSLAYSYDALNWTGLGTSIFGLQAFSVIWAGTIFLAGGDGSDSPNSLALSYDGINWTGLGKAIFTTNVTNLEWNGSMIVGVGEGTNTIGYSYDGIGWTGLGASIFSTNGRGIAWNGTIFVAVGVGTNTIAWSRNGITWTGLGTSVFSSGFCICWSGNHFVAGGSGTNTLAWSRDGINWTGLGATIITSSVFGVAWTGTRFVATGQVSSGANRIAYTAGADPSSGNWTAIGSFFSGGGNGGEAVYGGYWKWGGSATSPAIDFRTSGKNTAGITSANNGIAITGYNISNGVQRTLVNMNSTSNIIFNPSYILSPTQSTSSSTGALVLNGGIGMGNGVAAAPIINWGNTYTVFPSKQIALYDANNNNHQYYGLGIQSNQLTYIVESTAADHVFYAGTSSSTRAELCRIKGSGGINTPSLQITSGNGGSAFKILFGRANSSGSPVTISFGYTFSSAPTVIANQELNNTLYDFHIRINSISTTGFTYYAYASAISNPSQVFVAGDSCIINWVALGM